MSRYEEILKRSAEVIGERNTAELVVIAEELLLQIEKGIRESDSGAYAISMVDIIKRVPFVRKDFLSLESLFCILSSVNWRHNISTDISYDAEDFSLYLAFSKPSPRDEEPSIKNCNEKWMDIFTAPAIIVQRITKDSISKFPTERLKW